VRSRHERGTFLQAKPVTPASRQMAHITSLVAIELEFENSGCRDRHDSDSTPKNGCLSANLTRSTKRRTSRRSTEETADPCNPSRTEVRAPKIARATIHKIIGLLHE
jgi:hypothetical protein